MTANHPQRRSRSDLLLPGKDDEERWAISLIGVHHIMSLVRSMLNFPVVCLVAQGVNRIGDRDNSDNKSADSGFHLDSLLWLDYLEWTFLGHPCHITDSLEFPHRGSCRKWIKAQHTAHHVIFCQEHLLMSWAGCNIHHWITNGNAFPAVIITSLAIFFFFKWSH